MSKTGRNILPMEVKKAKGTYQACRDKGQPEVSDKKPYPPSNMTKRGKMFFHLLTKRLGNRATASYTEIQALCAARLEEIEEYDKTLAKEGNTFMTSNSFGDSIVKEHPACALREKALRHAQSLLVELGLTHISGLKFGAGKKDEKKNDFEGF